METKWKYPLPRSGSGIVDRITSYNVCYTKLLRKGTFFILGWVAEHYPEVVRKIHAQGHEIGCHSFYHDLVHRMRPADFYADTERAIKTTEDIIGEKVVLYRAPAFSVNENTPWAFETLIKLGIKIDCSIFPAKHDYGGFPNFGESYNFV